jgi:hypothetical protein
MAQVLECLPSKYEALNLNQSTTSLLPTTTSKSMWGASWRVVNNKFQKGRKGVKLKSLRMSSPFTNLPHIHRKEHVYFYLSLSLFPSLPPFFQI